MTEQRPLMTLMVALTCEAKPWIDFYRLKKRCARPFALYESDDLQLVISGIGAISMATAVGWVGGLNERTRIWLNLGTAGHATRPLGDIFHVHGSAPSVVGRAHYPPLVARWLGDSDALLSVDQPSSDYPEGAAVDMEANAFYVAAIRFSNAELVQSLKVVSDNAEFGFELLNAEKITQLMQPHVDRVDQYLQALSELVPAPFVADRFNDLLKIKATYSQQQQLINLLHKVSVLQLNDFVAEQQLNSDLPIKTVLSKLTSLVDQASPQLGKPIPRVQ